MFHLSNVCTFVSLSLSPDTSSLRALQKGWREEVGDAAVHTLCAMLTLNRDQIRHLSAQETGHYHFLWPASAPSPSASSSSAAPSAPSAPSLPASSSGAQEVCEEVFVPQKLGWLGGDVATSLYLPATTSSSSSVTSAVTADAQTESEGASQQQEKVIWLFGDSLLGLSSNSR